jgi:hypothetical protein
MSPPRLTGGGLHVTVTFGPPFICIGVEQKFMDSLLNSPKSNED